MDEWLVRNQRELSGEVDRVRAALECRAQGTEYAALLDGEDAAPPRAGSETALDVVARAFQLSPFERRVLVLCAGAELDGRFSELCGRAQGDSRRGFPSFGLSLALFPDAHWSALSPSRPLRRYLLVHLRPEDSLTQGPLRIDERVLHFLTGVDAPDPLLAGQVERVAPGETLTESHRALARRIAEYCARVEPGDRAPGFQLLGSDPPRQRAVFAEACRLLGLSLNALRPQDLPPGPSEREQFMRLLERETVLGGSALLLECHHMDAADLARAARLVERLDCPLLVSARDPLRIEKDSMISLDLGEPRARERELLWREALGEKSRVLDGSLKQLVAHFDLPASMIRAAARESSLEAGTDSEAVFRHVWRSCRRLARSGLDDLAQRMKTNVTWEDLVLPDATIETLRTIAAQLRHRSLVYEDWGFGRSARGLGIAALFSGPSGTGKTLAAEVLAHDLDLDLYRVDLSQVVSKYIGETEKNLERIFSAAERAGVILLFDEADALFGKRSEVKDSHDRYANVEVSYLLQRMEAYQGLAILTTNQREALDPAFLRRLRFTLKFPFPDADQRRRIWARVFPESTPRGSLDVGRLAELKLSGGNIRNVALAAAFFAAAEGHRVEMGHVLRAARAEFQKLEKPWPQGEFPG